MDALAAYKNYQDRSSEIKQLLIKEYIFQLVVAGNLPKVQIQDQMREISERFGFKDESTVRGIYNQVVSECEKAYNKMALYHEEQKAFNAANH